jgi:hypothetical protein
MGRSRESHGHRLPTASEAGISEERAELLRKVGASLAKRQPKLMDRWLADDEASTEEFEAAFDAEEQRMREAGEL